MEHAHTLDLLSNDQPRLQQALDQAGVPANRHLVLTLSDGGNAGSGGSQPTGERHSPRVAGWTSRGQALRRPSCRSNRQTNALGPFGPRHHRMKETTA